MKTINPWVWVRWGAVALVYALTVMIAVDQVRTRDRDLAEANRNAESARARLRKVVSERDDCIAMMEKWSRERKDSENSVTAIEDLQKKLDEALKHQEPSRKIEPEAKEQEAEPAPTQAAANQPQREPTDEEKLEAYRAGGISGMPSNISSEIIRKASAGRDAAGAVAEIEKQAKGYYKFMAFKKAGTSMPLQVRDGIAANAEREHPGNWDQMGEDIAQQVEAWNTIQGWNRNGVPGLTKQQSEKAIADAMRAHPTDWHTMIYRVNADAERLLKR